MTVSEIAYEDPWLGLVTDTQNLSDGAWRQVGLRFVDLGTSWVATHGCDGKDPGRLVWML